MEVASSLPTDLLLDIFVLLEPTDVIRCAGVYKPWRRAIIGNAVSLRPRPGRSNPRLLLGVFHFGEYEARLWRTPGPFQSALPSNGVGVFDRGLYRSCCGRLMGSSLLMARTVNRLCLFNPMTGDCAFLPAPAASKCSAYVLLTGYDDAASPPGTGNKLAVRILAVQKRDRFVFSKEEGGGLSYQVLFTSGAGAAVWGPVQRSGGGDESEVVTPEQGDLCVCMERRSTLVCRDAVYWLAGPAEGAITCTLALDVRTDRTWTTELPQYTASCIYPDSDRPILATSGDGRLSLIESLPLLPEPRIQVWVMLNGDDARWTLQQTIAIDLSNLLPPHCPCPDDEFALLLLIRREFMTDLSLSAFCPRSGCVVAVCWGGSSSSTSTAVRLRVSSGASANAGDMTVTRTRWIVHQLTSQR